MKTPTTPEATPEAIAARVRQARHAAGVSVPVLADHLGMAPTNLYRRLAGHTPFRVDELATLAHHLDVPVTALIEGDQGVTTR